MRFAKYLLILIIIFCSGCTSIKSIFKVDGYHNDLFPYKVNNLKNGKLLSSDWRLDNYKLNANGEPKDIKKGDGYEIVLNLGNDEEWRIDKIWKYPVYDLSFVNRKDDGFIWLRTIPLSWDMSQTKLRVMLRRIVESMAGDGLVIKKIDPKTVAGRSIRYATKIISSGPALIHGHEAYIATVEIANVNQLELSPESRWKRAEIVLIRTSYLWEPIGLGSNYHPVLMLAGYSNFPEDFSKGQKDFHNFLKRTEISLYPTLPMDEAEQILKCTPDLDEVRLIARKVRKEDKSFANVYEGVNKKKKSSIGFSYFCPDATKVQNDCINQNQFSIEPGRIYSICRKPLKAPLETKLPKLVSQ